MIAIYFSLLHGLPSITTEQLKLGNLPVPLQQSITAYQNRKDRSLSLCGKLLLHRLIKYFHLENKIALQDLQFTNNGKPFFVKDLQFNTSHANDLAICAASPEGELGIDVEHIAPVDLHLYADYFTPQEWESIHAVGDSIRSFYTCWTRKEAVIKASGGGHAHQLAAFSVLTDEVTFNGTRYYLQPVHLPGDYICHLASTIPNQQTEVMQIELFDL